MCDFSLEMYNSRPAVAGEDLILRAFPSGTNGFVPIADKDAKIRMASKDVCAVCLQEGVELILDIPAPSPDDHLLPHAFRTTWPLEPGRYEAVFTQKNPGAIMLHHDGLMIDKNYVSLQNIQPGTLAKVTKALPAELIDAVTTPAAFDPDAAEKPAHATV